MSTNISEKERLYILRQKLFRLSKLVPCMNIPDSDNVEELEKLHDTLVSRIKKEREDITEKLLQRYREHVCDRLELDEEARKVVYSGKLDKVIVTPLQQQECTIL